MRGQHMKKCIQCGKEFRTDEMKELLDNESNTFEYYCTKCFQELTPLEDDEWTDEELKWHQDYIGRKNS